MTQPSMEHFKGSPDWKAEAAKLVGRKIVDIRYLSDEEKELTGFFHSPPVMVLDNGDLVFPSADDEGNDGGALFGCGSIGDNFALPRC